MLVKSSLLNSSWKLAVVGAVGISTGGTARMSASGLKEPESIHKNGAIISRRAPASGTYSQGWPQVCRMWRRRRARSASDGAVRRVERVLMGYQSLSRSIRNCRTVSATMRTKMT